MAVTSEDLLAYVGASQTDAPFVGACLATATSLVVKAIEGTNGDGTYGSGGYGGYSTSPVPDAVFDRAVLEVGSELFHRRQAPNGIAQFASPDGGQAVRVARDPMVAARPILAPFLPLGFA